MMTSKQRSNLKSIAATMKPIAQVGKEGIGENLIKSLSEALEAHELIKVNLLPASGEDGDNLAMNIADLLHAEVVAVIGRKAIFYRRSSRKDFKHIEF
ncbi:MAG: YhbY family RNA-binding protein [Clostridia bacterium]|nr:YhbY family RNA-binding protein [Clostridia bacterium]